MEAVDYVKLRESGSYHHYMMVRLHENDLRREGAHDKAVETARALLSLGDAIEKTAQATGLPLAEVQLLANSAWVFAHCVFLQMLQDLLEVTRSFCHSAAPTRTSLRAVADRVAIYIQ